jgi:hypothetical protein
VELAGAALLRGETIQNRDALAHPAALKVFETMKLYGRGERMARTGMATVKMPLKRGSSQVQQQYSQMNKSKEEWCYNAIERSSRQNRGRNDSKESHDLRTTLTGAIPAQPCHKDKDVDRDLN